MNIEPYNTNIRNKVPDWTTEETQINRALHLVEHMGASEHLTNASILLSAARQAVAHHIVDSAAVKRD